MLSHCWPLCPLAWPRCHLQAAPFFGKLAPLICHVEPKPECVPENKGWEQGSEEATHQQSTFGFLRVPSFLPAPEDGGAGGGGVKAEAGGGL